jgi:hypothetical protein
MPPEIPQPAPTFVDTLEPYVRKFAALLEFFFPTLQRILAEGLAEFLMVTAIITGTAYLVKYAKDQYRHYHRMDDQTLSFSINFVHKNKVFKLRPVTEEIVIEELFKQLIRQKALIKAIRRTPKHKSVVCLPIKFESSIMGTIQSHVSKDFGNEFFTVASGRERDMETYVMMITYERYEDIPLRKVRIIFTHMDFFNNLPDYENSGLIFEKRHQQKRLLTLAEIYDTYHAMPPERRINHHLELPQDCFETKVDENISVLRSHRLNKPQRIIAKPKKIRKTA